MLEVNIYAQQHKVVTLWNKYVKATVNSFIQHQHIFDISDVQQGNSDEHCKAP